MTAIEWIQAGATVISTFIAIYALWHSNRQAKDLEKFKAELNIENIRLEKMFDKVFTEQFRVASELQQKLRNISSFVKIIRNLDIKDTKNDTIIEEAEQSIREDLKSVDGYYSANIHFLNNNTIEEIRVLLNTIIDIGMILHNLKWNKKEANTRITVEKPLKELIIDFNNQYNRVFELLQYTMGVTDKSTSFSKVLTKK